MTLLELVKELNDLVGNDLEMAQKEVDTHFSRICFEDDTQITFDDEEEDYYEPDVDESNFDPYCGCDMWEVGSFEDF